MTPLESIARRILDESSTSAELQRALDEFLRQCSHIGSVEPDRSFNAWAEDSFLTSGVAINPQAAAHCVTDYRRSVVFMRGLQAALRVALDRFPHRPLRILYAGCGPYATLLMPLLPCFAPEELDVQLLDIHQRSLDSVEVLLAHFELGSYSVSTTQTDASTYQHPVPLHLIVTETMQKSLEQEPQVAITRNLAPQLCKEGLFLPERIEVNLGLRDEVEDALNPENVCALARVMTLDPAEAPDEAPVTVTIPSNITGSAYLFTHVKVFGDHVLASGDAEISLPRPCPEIAPLRPGDTFEICYEPGPYPTFSFTKTSSGQSPLT